MDVDVLIVEDESELAAATAQYLEAFGLTCARCESAEAASEFLANGRAGVILLDVNLPGESGFAFCQTVRKSSQTPIIFASARTTDDDQILALSVGGDDYVTKPYSLAVLLAKIRRALDRETQAPKGFDDGRLRIDDSTGRTWLDGAELHLTTTEDRLLRLLVSRRGEVVPKQDIIDHLWGDPFTSDGTLSVHIRRLRSRIEDDPNTPRYIKTVWGRGYLFEDS